MFPSLRLLLFGSIVWCFSGLPLRAEEKPLDAVSGLMAGMKGSYETLESEIVKVYQADHNGAKFRAYIVKWKDQEVVVSDPLSSTDKNVGDKITFIAQTIEMPFGEKKVSMIQFMIVDCGALLKGAKDE